MRYVWMMTFFKTEHFVTVSGLELLRDLNCLQSYLSCNPTGVDRMQCSIGTVPTGFFASKKTTPKVHKTNHHDFNVIVFR